jgi:Skp family chaperone for outer membrane proteins
MGLKKLLNKLGDMLDPAVELRKKHRKKLKAILKELKTKEKALKEKLESTDNERKRDRLQKELDIVHKQRMKGVNAMRNDGNNDKDKGLDGANEGDTEGNTESNQKSD